MLGPGLLAGLSDDDPAGITTYSILGAQQGYELLWVLGLATIALVIFHELGARMGAVTGQGLAGLIRERYGVRVGAWSLLALLIANIGTTCAEFAGIAAGFELIGVSRNVSVPAAAVLISVLVLRGSFRHIERVLLALCTIFLAYIVAGILAKPDWGAAAHGMLVPSMPATQAALLVAVATIGTTLAPWGLSFIQSYVVDKRLRPKDMRYERVDVIIGAVLTGVIGVFVVVACAATLHENNIKITDARDAAIALEPLAGHLAATLFGVGLIGAAVLAASILPLSTAYSVTETFGSEAALDDSFKQAPLFYLTYAAVMVLGVVLVLIPGAPLIAILFLTQALNAVLLLPLLIIVRGLTRDHHLMGEFALSRGESAVTLVTIVLLAACLTALLILSVT